MKRVGMEYMRLLIETQGVCQAWLDAQITNRWDASDGEEDSCWAWANSVCGYQLQVD